MRKTKFIPIVVLLILVVAGVALAASQYSMRESVVSSGGGEHSSAGYRLTDVVGESVVGNSTSSNFMLRSGFLPMSAPTSTPTPTPAPGVSTPVTGITREVRGDILPGVSITLDGTGPVVSDQSGQYEILASSTGNHTVTAHKDGFRDRTQTINITGLGQGYAVTCNFQGQWGLIPNAPDIWYALDCVNRWLYPPNPDIGLDVWTALDVINAWLYPVQ